MNWAEVLFGAGIIAVTLGDIVPGDELIGIPSGLFFVADGFGWI